MIFRRGGFTLLELLVVISIIGIMAAALFPQMSFYFARGRDVARISDVKTLSAKFQEYSRINTTYPATENAAGTASGNCISEIVSWTDALPQFKDKQFSQLWGSGTEVRDPMNRVFWVWYCDVAWSYFYNNLASTHGVVAARMEIQTTWANYSDMPDLLDTNMIDKMVKAQPLDKNWTFTDYVFLIATN